MGKPNLGFSIFVASLLLLPDVPLSMLGLPKEFSLPLAAPIGLVLWLLLQWRVQRPDSTRSLSAFVLFAAYAATISALGTILSIAYAWQLLFYVVLLTLLLPVQLRERPEDSDRIIASVLWVVAGSILLSAFIGPLAPWHVGMYQRHFDAPVVRAVGIYQSANIAGCVAMLATLYAGSKGRWWLASACLAALALTDSRGAALGFFAGVAVLVALGCLRLVAGHARRASMAILCSGLLAVVVVPVGIYSWGMGKRSSFKASQLDLDAARRLEVWRSTASDWGSAPLFSQTFGTGIKSAPRQRGNGGFVAAHNGWLELLRDTGLIGATFFGSLYVVLVVAAAERIVRGRAMAEDHFAIAALVALGMQNMTQVFWYSPTVIFFMILAVLGSGRVERRRSLVATDSRLGDASSGEPVVNRHGLLVVRPRDRRVEVALPDRHAVAGQFGWVEANRRDVGIYNQCVDVEGVASMERIEPERCRIGGYVIAGPDAVRNR